MSAPVWPYRWESLMWSVNADVNEFTYVPDTTKYGKSDFWAAIGDDGGDCEDYAITKLRRLVAKNWPVETLHLACCFTETNEYHAVLIVDTPQGGYMLDNRQRYPVPIALLKDLQYKPHIIQAVGGKPEWNQWVA